MKIYVGEQLPRRSRYKSLTAVIAKGLSQVMLRIRLQQEDETRQQFLMDVVSRRQDGFRMDLQVIWPQI
jgi:hypothetical protein